MKIEHCLHVIERNLDMSIAEIAIPFIRLKEQITWSPFTPCWYSEEYIDNPWLKNGQKILTCDKSGNIEIDMFYDNASECWLESGRELFDEVIHWMPLPEPAKQLETVE